MSRPLTEYMNGGVVTSRVGTLLKPGELQRGDDCIYRDKDLSIWRAPGRVALNASPLISNVTPIKGLKYMPFEKGRDSQLVAYAGTKLLRAPMTAATFAAGGLTFQEISGVGSVAGSFTNATTFTATTGAPFTADAVGAILVFTSVATTTPTTAARVTAVGGAAGAYFSTLTVDTNQTVQACTISLDRGIVQTLPDSDVLGSPSVNEILGGAFFGSSYFIWLGSTVPYRLEWRALTTTTSSAGTESVVMRPVGLDPVNSQFTLTLLSGTDAGGDAYAWPAGLGTGVYWFLLTEIYGTQDAKGNDIDVAEAAYLAETDGAANKLQAGRPIALNVAALTNGVRLTTPPSGAVNNGSNGKLATHWAVYMSLKTDDAVTPPDISTFKRVKRVSIAVASTGYGVSQNIDIYDANNTQGWMYPSAVIGTADGKSAWTNATRMTGLPDTGSVATATSGGITNPQTAGQADAASALGTFKCEATAAAPVTGSPWTSRPVIGVTIRIRGYCQLLARNSSNGKFGTGGQYYVYLLSNSGKKSDISYGILGASTDTKYHGGPGSMMGVAWTAAEFGTSFQIVVAKQSTDIPQEAFVDSLGVLIHFGSSVVRGVPYRIVTFRDQIGTTASDPAMLPAKGGNTGDFFHGSLVMNDALDETVLRWSLPGEPELWPRPYQINFNTQKKDRITFIRALGPNLIVGLEESIKRVNYLPSENDTDLTTGLAQEDVTTDHGIAGPTAGVLFDFPGAGTMLAYAGSAGAFLTDAISARPINMDLDWTATVKLSALSTCIFRCYPKEKLLAFYYCPAGATHNFNTRVLYFSYQSDKIKEGGMLPAIGPCVVQARSAAEAYLNGTSYVLTGAENNGNIYLEDSGTTIPSGYRVRLTDNTGNGDGKSTVQDVQIVPLIRTRRFFAAGIDADAYTEKVYLLFSPFGAQISVASVTTLNSTTMMSSAAFGSVLPGMRVINGAASGIDPGTAVLSKASSSSLTTSRAANAASSGSHLFDSGTVSIAIRGSNLGEAVKGLRQHYVSTLVGDLVSVVSSNIRRAFELQFEKVPLTFDANGDTLTWADLGVNMRLHQFTVMLADTALPDTNRNAA